MSDKGFIRAAVLSILKHLVPTYIPTSDFRFEIFDTGQGYAVDTNLDYDALNKIYHQTTPPTHSSLSSEFMLRHIIDARSDSYFASNYMAEIVTAPIYSDIIRLKHFDFLRRREINKKEIEIFYEHILSDMPSLRESINAREVNVSDFLRLLDQADRFRNWIHSTNTDVGMVNRYIKDATEKTWADKIPTKSIRFVLATGLGIAADLALPTGIGTAAGVSVGALDAFYLDKLIKGWRPNQFIEGPYRAMLSRGTEANHQQ
ncbi:MAG: hypothetical protein KIT48_03685 [Pseudolabrys sp.]|nr:hypothetical protein [Pseudolabrys sp.]